MESRSDAFPNCPHCQGRGIVKTGERYTDSRICVCVVAKRKRAAAVRRFETVMPERCKRMTFDTFQTGDLAQNERALQVAKSFANNYKAAAAKGWVIGFHGEPRAGKTHLGVAILHNCTWRYGLQSPQLLNLPKALNQERQRYDNPALPSLLEQAQRAELLVLDDLGAEYHADADTSKVSWVSEQLYQLLDERLMHNLPLIFTSNLSPSDMERRYENEQWRRVYGRLETALVVPPLEVMRVKGATTTDPKARDLLFAPRT